jgi:flagellar hook assembly protein FlgD
VFAFPNPYVVNSDADKLNFNYSRTGTVRIYDISGALIAELSVNGSWDGKNQKGKAVASGVYLFVLAADNGEIGRGKFLLINKR